MITASILRRQTWMENDHELDQINKNAQSVIKLSTQY